MYKFKFSFLKSADQFMTDLSETHWKTSGRILREVICNSAMPLHNTHCFRKIHCETSVHKYTVIIDLGFLGWAVKYIDLKKYCLNWHMKEIKWFPKSGNVPYILFIFFLKLCMCVWFAHIVCVYLCGTVYNKTNGCSASFYTHSITLSCHFSPTSALFTFVT